MYYNIFFSRGVQAICQSFLADGDLSLNDTSSMREGGKSRHLAKPFSSLKQSCQLEMTVTATEDFGRR